MSESDKDKEILRLALENEAQNLVKTALEGSDSYRVLKNYKGELARESDRILQESVTWQRGTGKSKELTDEEKEILQRSRQASIILQRLDRIHVPAWHWISTILSLVPCVLFLGLVVPVQNIWLAALSIGVAILLFVPVILLSIFLQKDRQKRKAFDPKVVRLYLVEKWTPFNIAMECGISQKHLRKTLHRYTVELDG